MSRCLRSGCHSEQANTFRRQNKYPVATNLHQKQDLMLVNIASLYRASDSSTYFQAPQTRQLFDPVDLLIVVRTYWPRRRDLNVGLNQGSEYRKEKGIIQCISQIISDRICSILKFVDSVFNLIETRFEVLYAKTFSEHNENKGLYGPCVFAHPSATCLIFSFET